MKRHSNHKKTKDISEGDEKVLSILLNGDLEDLRNAILAYGTQKCRQVFTDYILPHEQRYKNEVTLLSLILTVMERRNERLRQKELERAVA